MIPNSSLAGNQYHGIRPADPGKVSHGVNEGPPGQLKEPQACFIPTAEEAGNPSQHCKVHFANEGLGANEGLADDLGLRCGVDQDEVNLVVDGCEDEAGDPRTIFSPEPTLSHVGSSVTIPPITPEPPEKFSEFASRSRQATPVAEPPEEMSHLQSRQSTAIVDSTKGSTDETMSRVDDPNVSREKFAVTEPEQEPSVLHGSPMAQLEKQRLEQSGAPVALEHICKTSTISSAKDKKADSECEPAVRTRHEFRIPPSSISQPSNMRRMTPNAGVPLNVMLSGPVWRRFSGCRTVPS